MSSVDISRSVLISFMKPFATPAFETRFHFLKLHVKSYAELVATVVVSAAKEIGFSK